MPDPTLSAWDVDEAEFPCDGSDGEQLAFLVRYAVLAANSHNTQPWLFSINDGLLEARADRHRRLPVVDPDDRALTISCGAALATLEASAHHFGRAAVLDLLPDAGDPDLLARVSLDERGEPPSDSTLFRSITRRSTNRVDYEDRPLPSRVIDGMTAAAEATGAWFEPIAPGPQREAAAGLIAQGDRAQWSDPAFRREISRGRRPNRSAAGDGMRGYAFGFGNLLSTGMPFAMRAFDVGRAQASTDRRRASVAPALVVVGTADDSVSSWLTAGRALTRVLLVATADGVSAAFLNQPIEVSALRTRLREVLTHAGWPQLLLRLGYAPQPARPEPRRPLTDVLQLGSLSRRESRGRSCRAQRH